jgi:hypothetical protein
MSSHSLTAHVYALLNMNEAHRKQRLLHLLATDYAGKKVAMARTLGNENKKARITQLAGDTEPFGEGAAENLESGLDLPTGWFNHTWPTPKEAEQYKIPIDQDYPAGIGIFSKEEPVAKQAEKPDFHPRPITLEEAFHAIAEALSGVNETGRKSAQAILAGLAINPDEEEGAAAMLNVLVAKYPLKPDRSPDPAPTKPTKSRAKTGNATVAKSQAKLTVKIGGGQTRQFKLPLQTVADPYDARQASAREQEWYGQIAARPKAKG